MAQTIKVEPYGKDWKVWSETLDEDMMFQSGAAAEAAARLLADAAAKACGSAEVQIYLRDGSLGARLTYPPLTAALRPRADAFQFA